MIRTQISLDEREYSRVKKQAARPGISVAELLRRAIREMRAYRRHADPVARPRRVADKMLSLTS